MPQHLATRSIIEVAIRPLKLTEQAEFVPQEAGLARRGGQTCAKVGYADGLAVTYVVLAPNLLIVICPCQD